MLWIGRLVNEAMQCMMTVWQGCYRWWKISKRFAFGPGWIGCKMRCDEGSAVFHLRSRFEIFPLSLSRLWCSWIGLWRNWYELTSVSSRATHQAPIAHYPSGLSNQPGIRTHFTSGQSSRRAIFASNSNSILNSTRQFLAKSKTSICCSWKKNWFPFNFLSYTLTSWTEPIYFIEKF